VDKQVVALLIPIVALSIPAIGILMAGLVKLQRERNASARLQAEPDQDVLAELEELRHDVAQLRGELSEVQERLDFTERLLAGSRDRPKLPGS
jgi:hypothetical protein